MDESMVPTSEHDQKNMKKTPRMKPADVVVDSHPVKKVLQPVEIDG
jgi:hypothetical protein